VEAPAYPYFDDYAPYPTDDRKAATTIEDFLTMRSGISWVTEGGYDDTEHSTVKLEASDDWIRFVLERPTDADPGTVYEYNDGVSVLLGKILREATGQRADDWARENLFEPIGIDEFYWKITPDGEADTEGGLYLSTHDLARIGYLFLRGGEWEGRQVISREWVETSTSPVVPGVEEDGTGPGYGYQWWVPVHEDGQTRIFNGNGYGGQFLFVMPEEDLVAVFNGWNHRPAGRLSTWSAFQQRILPALQ
jgi:CubicO group peptidase (beta-lactamase class C family)